MTKRILALLLVVTAVLSVLILASCGKKNGNDADEGGETLSPEQIAESKYIETYDPTVTAKDYNKSFEELDITYDGYEFTFLNTESYASMYGFIDPEMTGDVLDNTCWKRNASLEKKFDITISEVAKPFVDLASEAKTLILADEDVYDVMYIPAAHLTPLISENLFYDLLEIEELGMDQIWWDQPLIQRNIIENRLFYATSDLHLMAFEGVWAMYFNEDMMTDLGLEMPFELALSGNWTFEELQKYCSAAANLNGDASFTFDVNGNATYGMSCMSNPGHFAYSMGAEFTERDENGRHQFTAHEDKKFLDTWEKLVGFYGPDNGLTYNGTTADLEPDGYYGAFLAERALFVHAELKGATMIREGEVNFGLLPQPKYDASQEEYNSGVFNNCPSFCIPNTNTNLERTGTIVDYMTYLSYAELLPRYYDIHVSLKALGKQESKDVLALIRGTRGCQVAVPYQWANDLNAELGKLAITNTLAVSSTIDSFKDQVIAKINATYDSYPDLKHAE